MRATQRPFCVSLFGVPLVISIMSPGWTVEDQDALSRFISYLVAALSTEVYIGVQSLHTSSVGSVQVGESDFEFDLAVHNRKLEKKETFFKLNFLFDNR